MIFLTKVDQIIDLLLRKAFTNAREMGWYEMKETPDVPGVGVRPGVRSSTPNLTHQVMELALYAQKFSE